MLAQLFQQFSGRLHFLRRQPSHHLFNQFRMPGEHFFDKLLATLGNFRIHQTPVFLAGFAGHKPFLLQLVDRIRNVAAAHQHFVADLLGRLAPLVVQQLQHAEFGAGQPVLADRFVAVRMYPLACPGQYDQQVQRLVLHSIHAGSPPNICSCRYIFLIDTRFS